MKGVIKMKNTYEARAFKFAALLVRLFASCATLEDFEEVICEYNATHTIPLQYAHGVSRIAILRADYVIKFNLLPDDDWMECDGTCRAGDNFTEANVYARAERDGYAYLLAKTTLVHMGNRLLSIMPRINGVNDWYRYWGDHVTEEEYDWLCENVHDIHEGNVGYYRGKPVVIDYGWDAEM